MTDGAARVDNAYSMWRAGASLAGLQDGVDHDEQTAASAQTIAT